MSRGNLKIIFGLLSAIVLTSPCYAQMDNAPMVMDNAIMTPPMEEVMINTVEPITEIVGEDAAEDDMADGVDASAQAIAIIEGTKEDSELYGEVEFVETKDGLSVTVEVYNAPIGKHGIHIHENGSCEDAGNAAGGHFNPDSMQHGMVANDGLAKAHVGDLGNIEVDQYGDGLLTTFIPGASLAQGKYSVIGKAIILHEKEDDFGQPTGNAGSRIGCGVIEKTTE